MKKGLILSAVLLLLAVSDVSAKTVAKNKDTGKGSINIASAKKTSTTTATTVQGSLVLNGALVLQNTGANDVNNNTKVLGGSGPVIKTGNATTNVTINNKVNKSTTEVTGCGCEGDNKAVNDQTGAGSINVATVENTNTTTATTVQEAAVINVVVVGQNTGANDVNNNTKVVGSGVDTGNATSNTTIDNKVNNSETTVN